MSKELQKEMSIEYSEHPLPYQEVYVAWRTAIHRNQFYQMTAINFRLNKIQSWVLNYSEFFFCFECWDRDRNIS